MTIRLLRHSYSSGMPLGSCLDAGDSERNVHGVRDLSKSSNSANQLNRGQQSEANC